MTDKIFDNNQVNIAGEVVGDFVYSHEVFGEKFYILDVSVSRLSDSYDIIPLMISERLIDIKQDYKGQYLEVSGQFRSYNRHDETKNRLVLSVFVREVTVCEAGYESAKPNYIFLEGFISKQPVYRNIKRFNSIHILFSHCHFIICKNSDGSSVGLIILITHS